jgi:glycyl-tRNA synthetase beta chain
LPSLLFEIGCEELPASACREAEAQLRERIRTELGDGEVYVGPRRLAILVPEVAEREPDRWVQGPPEKLRENAAAGFAKKQGVAVDDLEVAACLSPARDSSSSAVSNRCSPSTP